MKTFLSFFGAKYASLQKQMSWFKLEHDLLQPQRIEETQITVNSILVAAHMKSKRCCKDVDGSLGAMIHVQYSSSFIVYRNQEV